MVIYLGLGDGISESATGLKLGVQSVKIIKNLL